MLKEYTYTGGTTSIRRKDDHNFRLMVCLLGKEKVMIGEGHTVDFRGADNAQFLGLSGCSWVFAI